MAAAHYATALREQLGDDGYDALAEMMRVSQERLLTTEHFEARLSEELGYVCAEMHQLRADIRIDIAERSAELMKWAMLFWVAQAAAVAGIVAALR